MLPDTMFGYDTDEVFAYTTPKVAWVRDRYVGLGYYCLLFLALCWVIIGQILWRNEHFQLKDVRGIARMWVSHPTLDHCDANVADCMPAFKPLSSLPYCIQNPGASVKHPARCKYGDKFNLLPDGVSTNTMFIPTVEIVMEEKKSCQPSPDNNWECDALYTKEGTDKAYYMNETRSTYYANIEDYVVQFTSTYHRDTISGTSLKHASFYKECQDKPEKREKQWDERINELPLFDRCEEMKSKEVECLPGAECNKEHLKKNKLKIGLMEKENSLNDDMAKYAAYTAGGRRLRASAEKASVKKLDPLLADPPVMSANFFGGHSSAQSEGADTIITEEKQPDVYATVWGDTFKLGKLMELAGIDLDNHYNMDGYTTRMAGTIIEVEVVYENMRRFLSSFGFSQVRCSYKVVEKKLPYISREWLATVQPPEYPDSRRYVVQHGVVLVFNISGEFGFFSIVYLLIMLTTAMALLGTAHKVTDLFSIYGHPRKKNYFHIKYDVSPDFSDMWECKICGYYNSPDETNCRGIPQWCSEHDEKVEVCGEPRHASARVGHDS